MQMSVSNAELVEGRAAAVEADADEVRRRADAAEAQVRALQQSLQHVEELAAQARTPVAATCHALLWETLSLAARLVTLRALPGLLSA